jgi:hypothetical protein
MKDLNSATFVFFFEAFMLLRLKIYHWLFVLTLSTGFSMGVLPQLGFGVSAQQQNGLHYKSQYDFDGHLPIWFVGTEVEEEDLSEDNSNDYSPVPISVSAGILAWNGGLGLSSARNATLEWLRVYELTLADSYNYPPFYLMHKALRLHA